MRKPLLILGIDPGTTTAYALLNTKGKLVKKKSSKILNRSSLISEIIKLGKVVVVGSDKKTTPKFVENIARKLGAKIIKPKKDLLVKEKKHLTRNFDTKDSHEFDALASAIFSYKEISSLLRKIEFFVRKHKKEEFENKLKELVLTKDINIKNALELIEKPKEKIKIIEKIIERKITDKDFLVLSEKIKRLEKENKLLRKQNERLKNELKKDRERYKYLKRKIEQLIPDEKAEELLSFKEERIISLQRDINLKDQEINELENRINDSISFISKINGKVLIKKLKSLGWIEFSNKKMLLNIKKGDILLVDDLASYSEKALKELKNYIDIIISNKSNKEVKKKFVVVKKKDIKLIEIEHFALADEKEIEKIMKGVDILDKVVREYREEGR